jgi:hypothetical protein
MDDRDYEAMNKHNYGNDFIADVSERLYSMQLHEEWIVGVSQGNQAQLTICRVPSGWIYNYRTGNGKLTSTFVPFDNRFQNAR